MDQPSVATQDEIALQSTVENDKPGISLRDLSELPPSTKDKLEAPVPLDENGNPLSKNRLKKLKKDQEWEANRAKRKAKRKEKEQEKKQRKRAIAAATASACCEEGAESAPERARLDPEPSAENEKSLSASNERTHKKHIQQVQLPVTFVLDCGFDELMKDTEIKSLSGQVTRSYSDCHRAPYQARLMVCSFNGRLKERFESVLACNHKSWKGVKFLDEDFMVAAEQARNLMNDDKGANRSKMAAAFAKHASVDEKGAEEQSPEGGEVVYLTSDSENTLSELKPYSTYIIGGIIDKNRHKGICYKRAMEKGVKTAKLPIGEYMQMQSRFVLATNHVVEIMLKWLECGNWGDAFMSVIPKRKGGSLKISRGENGGGSNGVADRQEREIGRQDVAAIDAQKEYEEAVDKDADERNELDREIIDLPAGSAEPASD